MPGTVALTGATGFIGTTLRRALADAGWHVRALTRTPRPSEPAVDWIHGDLASPAALARLVRDTGAVIHCAGTVRGASRVAFERVNVAGTAALLDAVRAMAPPPRFLFISSLAAREPGLSWYAASKAAAESLVHGLGTDVHWTILRPTVIYGPGDREMRPLFRWMLRGIVFTPQPPGGRFSLLHVDDLAAAIVRWLQRPAAAGLTCELGDGTDGGYDAAALAQTLRARGRTVRIVHVPGGLLRVLARANLAAARVVGRAPMLTPGKVRELLHPDWRADPGPFIAATGWSPRIRFLDALAAGTLFFT
jgi:nucleoside-diphosphate-sugar epimerase